MRVQCALCDKIDNIPDFSTTAKKLRNKPIRTYLCDECNTRITENTEARITTMPNFYSIYTKVNPS